MCKQIKLFHCAGKHLLTTITAIVSILQLSGVLECCNIPRSRPQGRNTKPCSFQYILPSSKANSLAVPSLHCLCGNILMTWNILLLSSKPDHPSARFHLGVSVLFALVLNPWESMLSVCTIFRYIMLLSSVYKSPLHVSVHGIYRERLICWKKHRIMSQKLWESSCVWPWTLSPSLWFSVFPSVKWRIISSHQSQIVVKNKCAKVS